MVRKSNNSPDNTSLESLATVACCCVASCSSVSPFALINFSVVPDAARAKNRPGQTDRTRPDQKGYSSLFLPVSATTSLPSFLLLRLLLLLLIGCADTCSPGSCNCFDCPPSGMGVVVQGVSTEAQLLRQCQNCYTFECRCH